MSILKRASLLVLLLHTVCIADVNETILKALSMVADVNEIAYVFNQLGADYIDEHDYVNAKKMFQQAVETNCEYEELTWGKIGVIRCNAFLGDFDIALKDANELNPDPNSYPDIYTEIVLLYEEIGSRLAVSSPKRAIPVFIRIIDKYGDTRFAVGAHLQLARCYRRLEDHEKTLTTCWSLIEQWPDSYHAKEAKLLAEYSSDDLLKQKGGEK
ncbi:MAG: tetratricopeptide repeat protein [Planctomycetota bacterium]